MRRRIGPAYELCPAEKLSRWVGENLLRLLSAVVVAVAFCLLTNWVVVKLMNFLAAEDYANDIQQKFSADTPVVSLVKVVGSVVLIWLICRTPSK